MKKEDVQKRAEEIIKDIERKPKNPSYKLSRAERHKAERRLGMHLEK